MILTHHRVEGSKYITPNTVTSSVYLRDRSSDKWIDCTDYRYRTILCKLYSVKQFRKSLVDGVARGRTRITMLSMVLPEFREDGWLPEGHHATSWEEVVERFGGSPGSRRERVLHGLLDWRDRARGKGISGWIILDGSFVSAKENPGDFDVLVIFDDHAYELMENDVEAKELLDYSSCKEKELQRKGL